MFQWHSCPAGALSPTCQAQQETPVPQPKRIRSSGALPIHAPCLPHLRHAAASRPPNNRPSSLHKHGRKFGPAKFLRGQHPTSPGNLSLDTRQRGVGGKESNGTSIAKKPLEEARRRVDACQDASAGQPCDGGCEKRAGRNLQLGRVFCLSQSLPHLWKRFSGTLGLQGRAAFPAPLCCDFPI